MDEFGLPVQRPSIVPAYLFMAGSLVCAVVSGGIWIAPALYESDNGRDFSRPVGAAAGVIGLLPLVAARKIQTFNKVLGTVAGTIMALAVAASVLAGFFQLWVAIRPHAACSPHCGTS